MKKHDIARRFEHQLAEELGGRRLFASGAGFEKADIRVRQGYKSTEAGIAPVDALALRVEAKTTSLGSYTFRVQDWADVARSARQHGEAPVFAVHFVGPKYSCVLINAAFAIQLGLRKTEECAKPIKKSWAISYLELMHRRQRTFVSCTVNNKEELLVLVPYTDFLTAVRLYAPDG